MKQVLTFKNCSAARLLLRFYDYVDDRHQLGQQLCENWTGTAIQKGSLTQRQLLLPSRVKIIWSCPPKNICMACGDLNESAPQWLWHLNTLSPIVCAVWGCLEGVMLFEEVHHWR